MRTQGKNTQPSRVLAHRLSCVFLPRDGVKARSKTPTWRLDLNLGTLRCRMPHLG